MDIDFRLVSYCVGDDAAFTLVMDGWRRLKQRSGGRCYTLVPGDAADLPMERRAIRGRYVEPRTVIEEDYSRMNRGLEQIIEGLTADYLHRSDE